jgi:nicotinamidase-related amidase
MRKREHVIHRSQSVLIILDMLNRFDFPGGRELLPHAEKAARKIARLAARARERQVPVIFVNDNLGQWRSNWHDIYEKCRSENSRGRNIAELLPAAPEDYFVLKPKHSAFYSTCLDVLLSEIGAKRLILTGIAADICVLFSAYDAHIRNYEIAVPNDCVAAETETEKARALELMKKAFQVRTQASRSLNFALI